MSHIRAALSCNSSFAKACICAIVVGLGSLIAIGTDIVWLTGDMLRDFQRYHIGVMVGLGIALLITVASFVWLFVSLKLYGRKLKRKKRHEREMLHQLQKDREMFRSDQHIHKPKPSGPYKYFDTLD